MTIPSGRFDGAPEITIPTSIPGPASSPLYTDGVPVYSPPGGPDIQVFPGGPGPGGPPGRLQASGQRFWSSLARPAGSPHQENLVVSLARGKPTNYISLELPHFPHRVTVYWMDENGNWQPVMGPNGSVLVYSISGSVPAVVNNASAASRGDNPFHFGAGHWIHFDEMIQPITTNQLMFSCTREFSVPSLAGSGAFPVNPGGHPSPYPLGIRNLDFGYRVRRREDIPWSHRSPGNPTERDTFTVATDYRGSPVSLSVRENRASDLAMGLPWKCAPQVRSDAVVSLYADSRDGDGNPQVIDKAFVDPVTTGVRVNLYYAPDPPPPGAAFQALDTPLIYPLVSVSGSQLPAPDTEGLLFGSHPGWLDLSIQGAGASSGSPWWTGIEVMPQFSSSDTGTYVIADGGVFQLIYRGGTWIVSAAGGTLAAWSFPFDQNQALTFVAGFDGNHLFAWSPLAGAAFVPAMPRSPTATRVRFGAALNQQLPLNLNYSFETGIAPWAARGNAALAQSSLWAQDGVFSMLITPNGVTAQPGAQSESVPVSPSTPYSISASLFSPQGLSPGMQIGVIWMDGNGAVISTVTGSFAALVAGTPKAFQLSATSPPAAAFARIIMQASGTPSSSVQVLADDAMIFSSQILPGNYRLSSFVLKQEFQDFSGDVPGDFMSFARNARAFVAPAAGPGPTTMNALARFDSSFVLGTPADGINPYGFVGGPGSSYELCTWVPIQRDYILVRGFMEFDPVLASVFKFEFTSLQPQTFEFFDATPQKVRTFPVIPPRRSVPFPFREILLEAGLTANQNIAPTVNFADGPPVTLPPRPGAALPTEALYAIDAAAAAALARLGGSLYNFQPWHPDLSALLPRFTNTGVHAYQETELKQVSRVAYFVSLSALQLYRTEYEAEDDAEIYRDSFQDTHNIDPRSLAVDGEVPSPWSWQPGQLFTPQGLPGGIADGSAQIVSNVFSSKHTVRGVQFAVTQSDPVQLLADPDFSDPSIAFWASVGDAVALEIAQNVNAQLGSMVRVKRIPSAFIWASLGSGLLTWDQVAVPGRTWDQVQGSGTPSDLGGMTYTGAPVQVTKAGRVYAAARVFSPVPLTAPLTLQILDGVTGAPLAEADVPVAGGTVTEWYTGYTIGAGGSAVTRSWAEVMALFPTWNSTSGQGWSSIDTFVPPLGTTLTAQVIQKGVTSDTWFVDNISLFEDSVVWEFSNDGGASWWPAYDIRNNPRGVLIFPPPASGKGNQLMWRLSGYRPGLHVSGLAIRPWYSVHPTGVRPAPAGIGHGPNLSPGDHYSDVAGDPHWQMWDQPIPQDWFFLYRQLLLAAGQYVTVAPPASLPSEMVLGNALSIPPPPFTPPPAVPPAPQTYTDVYASKYTLHYGIPDGSDIFTDTYNDNYPGTS